MTAVTNHGARPIGFPTGELIAPGETVEVTEWAKHSARKMYAALIESGELVAKVDPIKVDTPPVKTKRKSA